MVHITLLYPKRVYNRLYVTMHTEEGENGVKCGR